MCYNYLNPLDQFIKRELKCQAYLRYVDDSLLFADDKATLPCGRPQPKLEAGRPLAFLANTVYDYFKESR